MENNRQDQEEVRDLLQEAVAKAEGLQARLDHGEKVSEDEMTRIAKDVANAIEEANAKLRAMLGPIDSALLREKMVENMTPEEFEQWSEENAALMEHRGQGG